MKQFLIAFHENNRAKALSLEKELSPSGCSFQLLSSRDAAEPGEFNRKLLSSSQHVLLLVSDNLLKSDACMYGGLEAIQQLSSANRLLPIVIDGEYPGEENVTTIFERVGDVIQYLNFWQDEYINLRQKRRHLEEGEDQEGVNEALRIVRQVSSEIGEYLRHLRVVNHYSRDQVSRNEWELFFKLIQYPEGHARLKESRIQQPQAQAANRAPDAEEESVQPQLMEPLEEEEDLMVDEAEEAPPVIEWTELPGIASLSGPPPETPELPEQAEEPESISDLIHKLVKHAEESRPVTEQAREEEALLVPEISEVEDLFKEAVSEAEEKEGEEEAEAPEVEEPEEADAIMGEADHQFEKGEFIAGLNLLTQAIDDFPNSAKLRYRYAQCLVQYAHNPREAAFELEKLVRLSPEHIPAWFMLGELAEMGKQYRQARQYYEHAVYLDSDFDMGYYRLGLLLSNFFEGEEKMAAKYFKKATKANEELADAYYQRGTLLYERLEDPGKAVKSLKKTLKYQPDHPFAHYDLALIYYGLGEQKKASQHYRKAIANNPEVQTPENDEAFYSEPEMVTDQEEVLESVPEQEAVPEKKSDSPYISQGIAMITGATSGIGRATARAFAKAGYSLILTGRREDRLEQLQEELQNAHGVQVRILCFDVRDHEEVAEHLNELEESWKNVDILVNNAGLAKGLATIQEGELSHWETMIDTNLKGLLYITRIVTPWMVSRQSGHVINIGSIAGKEAYPKGNVYCATKFAVDGLTRAMRMDLYQYGIRVSQVCPGHVEETEFALVRFDGDAKKAKIYEDFKPLSSSDVAGLILYIVQAPPHVNIQDVVITSAQQASATMIDRSGRED
jgi:NADP-dependent 3-hydroxy acid dehydrogenase YdfG/Flp pilus assembly protein TadD